MIYPVHHIPGRLRLKCLTIKGDAQAAQVLRNHLQAIAGIDSVEVSAVTGSAVINYSRHALAVSGILEQMNGLGYPVRQGALPEPCSQTRPAGRLVEKMMESAVERLLERSAVALVAALI